MATLTRRNLLKRSSLIALAPTVPGFLAQLARAVEAKADDRVLVVVQLDGGNDGINTVVPFRDDGYAKHRDRLRLPADRLHKLTGDVALHPFMRPMADLFAKQKLAIVEGVGYPNPNRSHDVSMAIISEFGRRVAENASAGTDHGTAGPMFLAGGGVRGGLHGGPPRLLDLDAGDLKMSVDFRRVYAAVLRDWLGVDPLRVLDGPFEPVPLFSASG